MRPKRLVALLLLGTSLALGASLVHSRQTKSVQKSAKTPATANLLADGSFEAAIGAKSPWYLLEQAEVVVAADAPHGKRVIRFRNKTPGRASQAKQHIRLDGRATPAVDVSLRVKLNGAGPGQSLAERPSLVMQFYDETFTPVGAEVVGPWSGTIPWTQEQARITVPERSRVALVTVGLAGGTGSAEFDQIELTAAEVNPSTLPRKSGSQ